ncbi:MAG: hypothetical protein OEV08_03450 [Nitrospira sp.]|nr:hypothetical protein [Nitrospira sp.]
MATDNVLSLNTIGLEKQEALLLSCLLTIHADKLSKVWELTGEGVPHAILCDLSSPEGQQAWQEAQGRMQPIPIAYTAEPMPSAQWRLAKPVESSSLIELMQKVTSCVGEQAGAPVSSPVVSRSEEPASTSNAAPSASPIDSSLRDRLTVLAEQHQATESAAAEIKLIFGGSTGAGKSTALRTISDVSPILTEARPSDMVRRMKSETTVAMDYGELTLSNGKKLRLYGTPGQVRFEFMSEILCKGAMGLVLLANNVGANPLHELTYYLRLHGDFIKRTAAVLGITHMDQKSSPTLEEFERYLAREKWNIPVFSVDVRNREQVLSLIETLVVQLEEKGHRKS